MLTREITFPVEVEELWAALADPSEWIGARVEWDLVPGGRARFLGDVDGERAGEVDDVQPGRRLSFRWWPEGDRDDESEVTYELEPGEEGTRLTVTERRVRPVDAPQASVGWTCWDDRLAALWGGADHRGKRVASTAERRVLAGSASVRLPA